MTPRCVVVCLNHRRQPIRKWFKWFTCRGPCGGIVVPEFAVDPNLSFRTLCREQGQPLVARSRFLPFLMILIRGHLNCASAVGGSGGSPFLSVRGDLAWRAHAAHGIRSRDCALS